MRRGFALFLSFFTCLVFETLCQVETEAIAGELFDIDVKKENSVYVVTGENLQALQNSAKYLMINFYYNECQYCQNFKPIYEQVSKEVKAKYNDIKFTKVDVTVYPKLSTKFKVAQFPTIILLTQGEKKFFDFNGDLNKEEFTRWTLKKTFESTFSLRDYESTKNFVESQHSNGRSSIVFFKGTNNEEYKDYLQIYSNIAKDLDNFDFAVCEYDGSVKDFNANNGVIVITHTNNERVIYDLNAAERKTSLESWILKNAYPFVIPFDFQSSELLFGRFKPGIFLYRKQSDSSTYDEAFQKASIRIRQNQALNNTLFFITCGNETSMEVQYNLHFNNTNFPIVKIHDTSDTTTVFKNYVLKTEISEENIYKFALDFLEGKIQGEESLEETTPENDSDLDTSDLMTLAKSFYDISVHLNDTNVNEEVLESPKSVLLLAFNDNDSKTSAYVKVFEQFAGNLNEALTISTVKVDVSTQQKVVELLKLDSPIPFVRFYAQDNKTNYTNYEVSDLEYNGLKSFLENNIGRQVYDLSDPEEVTQKRLTEEYTINANSTIAPDENKKSDL